MNSKPVYILFAIGIAAAIAFNSGCAKEAKAQQITELDDVPVARWEEGVEEYEVEITEWRPETRIEKRQRKIMRPVFVRERILGCEEGPVLPGTMMEIPEGSVLEAPAPAVEVEVAPAPAVEVIAAPPCPCPYCNGHPQPVGAQRAPVGCVRNTPARDGLLERIGERRREARESRQIEEPEVAAFQMGEDGAISVPRVTKKGPFRNIERRDTIIVDGFEGSGPGMVVPGTPSDDEGTRLAERPGEGFGGVQVGIINRNNQPLSNAVMDFDRDVQFSGPSEQRIMSVQAEGISQDEEDEDDENVGPIRRLLRRGRGRGTSSPQSFRSN